MPTLKQRWTRSNSAVALLILAATGSVLFTAIEGAWVHSNTQKLIATAAWVEHTQDVITSLQRAALLTERIEYRSRLYLLTGQDDQLVRVRTSASALETAADRLATLVADNPYQTGNASSLSACSAQLGRMAANLNPRSPIPDVQVQACQQIIGKMTDQEQWLLRERTANSQRLSFASIQTLRGFVALSLLTFAVLFFFLFRDAVMRERIGKETAATNERLANSVNALEDQAHETELMTSVRDELQLCTDVQQVYQAAVNGFSRLLRGTSGSLCMIDSSQHLVEVVSSWEGSGGKSQVVDFHPPEACCGLRAGQPRWRQPGVSEIHCTHFAGDSPERYFCKPIMAHGSAIGMLYMQCPDERVVLKVNQRMDGLRHLIQLTGMTIAALNLRARLESQSIRDSLTGLFNRHFMQISLERELARAARRQQTLAVVMLDLDHFKTFNDTHGHGAGDTVLKAIAAMFRSTIRNEDFACRYGGEEFTIILPDITQDAASERVESIRKAVENLRVPLEGNVFSDFTVSIGDAFYPEDGEAAELLLRRADLALYRAKRLGRNQASLFAAKDPVA